MSNLHRDKTLALAAVFQAAGLVNSLARKGRCDETAEQFLIRTSLVLDTDEVSAIYQGPAPLKIGIDWLQGCLTDNAQGIESPSDIVRLVLAILQAEKHFRQHGEAQHIFRGHFDRMAATPPEDNELTEQLAKAYVESLGILRFRVQIHGDARHLQSPGTPERIRAILLAGIRAAWLWQRLGGRRWHLLITRGQILEEISAINKSV